MHFFSRSKLLATFSPILIFIVGCALLGSMGLTTHAVGITPKLSLTWEYHSPQKAASCGAWSIIPSPSPGPFNNNLFAVAAITKNNVWAVGYAEVLHTLIEHWNGKRWSVVTSPSPGTGSNILSGIAAISANNIWAVGNSGVNGGFPKTLVEHWN